MLAVANNNGVPCFLHREKLPTSEIYGRGRGGGVISSAHKRTTLLEIYCCSLACAADARSVSNSQVSYCMSGSQAGKIKGKMKKKTVILNISDYVM